MILVDSSVWIDFFNGAETPQVNLLDANLGEHPILIGDLILTEVLQGFRSDKDFETAKQALDQFECRAMVGHGIALKSAENYRHLRKADITVRKTIDVLIATFCIENSLSLLHSDRDFEPMENVLGLAVV
ncbi:PIN domain nuclease [Parvularcula sp. IMCC14364]|uniref:type II toxin-antitoxin system VapC family toxin n=1 Tax=Parvularcula sp. IMCC14364 TaxID=3067902 RepID=UPI0027418F88|nr:PIN domain nuclease [Parvularcula sp. IMCC14364]